MSSSNERRVARSFRTLRPVHGALALASLIATACVSGPQSGPAVEFGDAPSDSTPSVRAPSDADQTATSDPSTDTTAQEPTTSPSASGMSHSPRGSAATDPVDTAGTSSTLPADTAGSTGTAGTTGSTQVAGVAASSLSVTITTVTQNGKYAPLNVGAIWIETTSGQWLDTLEWWNSRTNAHWLTRYGQAGGPAYDGIFTKAPADVITSATLRMHKTHSSSWNLQDSSGKPLPPGTYRVAIELTEQNSTGKSADFEFQLGPDLGVVPTTDATYYKDVALELK